MQKRKSARHVNAARSRWRRAEQRAEDERDAGIDDAAIEELCGECASLGTETLLTGDEIRDCARRWKGCLARGS